MPKFQYWAKQGPTETIEGFLDAENRSDALAQLTGMGVIPVRIVEAGKEVEVEKAHPTSSAKSFDRKIRSRTFNLFTRQFASLVHSAVPLYRAIMILREQTYDVHLKRVLEAIEEDIRQGHTLSEGMEKFPKVFSPLYISLVRSGEIAGMLDSVLERLSVQIEKEEALHSKIQSALIYPAFVGIVGIGTVIFLLSFVMPRLVKLFQGFGEKLPWPTQLLLGLAHLSSQSWFWAAVVFLLAGCAVFVRIQRTRLGIFFDRFQLHLPVLGSLVYQLEITRFTRSFGLLINHGVNILQATEVAIPVVKNRVIRQELQRLPSHLREGNRLTSSLRGLRIATPFLLNTVAIGEESGKMGEALLEVSNFYEREVERLLNVLAAMLEPMMILLVGGIVGFIVMAVMLPIFELSVIAG